MGVDHIVPFRNEMFIKDDAQSMRQFGRIGNAKTFDITDFVETTLIQKYKTKGQIYLDIFLKPIFHDDGKECFAWVDFEKEQNNRPRQVILHVNNEIWNEAKNGDGRSRFIVAHEIGHIYLHDHIPSSFSRIHVRHFQSQVEEISAEWQANTFAKYFLLPDNIVLDFVDKQSIMFHCNIDEEIAKDRLEKVNKKYKRTNLLSYYSNLNEGDACPECANFTLVRNGTRLECKTCGGVTVGYC